MSDTRREFLANCLGGTAFLASGLAMPQLNAAEPTDSAAPKSDVFERTTPPGTHPVPMLGEYIPSPTEQAVFHVKTNFKPHETKINWKAGSVQAMFVQELLLQFSPGDNPVHRVALHMVLHPTSGPRLRFQNGKPFDSMYLVNEQEERLPVRVLSFTEDSAIQLQSVLVLATATVEVTDLDLSFLCCNKCGTHERYCDFTTSEHFRGWSPLVHNNLGSTCPRCHSVDRSLLRMSEADLHRVYITCTTSHVACYDPAKKEKPAAQARFNPNTDRGTFICQAGDLPIAQLYPTPDYLTDVFLSRMSFPGI